MLINSGRPDTSLPFCEQAATQARTATEATQSGSEKAREAWSDVGSITGIWAKALLMTRHLDAAHQRWTESAEAKRKGERPPADVIASELEALRIDIKQRPVAEALPEVETRLARVEAWWRQHRSGQSVPEAPDPVSLANALISALDIAKEAHIAQRDWEPALQRIDAILEVEQALKRPAENIAATRVNRANVLGKLRRFGEAKAELENCLQVFQHDSTMSAKVLNSFAALFGQQGDWAQAITQVRRALALCEQLPDPMDRVIAHNNLANYLERSGAPPALAESRRHQLAALVYRLVARLGQSLQLSLHNYAVRFRSAHGAGTELEVPRVADLLADPAFRPLDDWLRQRKADIGEVQAAVDQALEQARQTVLGQ